MAVGLTYTKAIRLNYLHPLIDWVPTATPTVYSTDVYHTMVAATIDTPAHAALACGLWLVLALFVRLRFQHDSVVAGATDGAVGVGAGVTCSSG